LRTNGSRKPVLVAALVAVALAGVSACDAEEEPTPPSAGAPSVAWGQCPQASAGTTRDPRLTCATVKAPLDYRDPDGPTIDLAISRLPTAKPEKRHGVLLVNPGGPGLPGLDLPGDLARTLPAAVLDGYDLIGFDPRGVAHSTPQSCGLADPSVVGLFPYPAADGSTAANVDLARAQAERCAGIADRLRHFTTANTARDLDGVRKALGEEKVSYWGQSYGTYLGAVYGSLFPDRVDRMVLEGNVDPTAVWAGSVGAWSKGVAERFPDAARVAASQDGVLGLGGTVDEVTRTYLALADRLDRTPAPIAGTALTGALLRNVTHSLLLHNETLPVLARFWRTAANLTDGRTTDADGEVLRQVFADTPATPGIPADNQATMFLALDCGDTAWSHDLADYTARTAADRAKWPLTAGMPADVWACAFWPTQPVEAPVTVSDNGPRTTLVLQNKRDNATPWDAGIGLRKALGKRAAFVGVDNGGHYVFNAGSACADAATVDFLTTGHLPDDDITCTDAAQP
jgi:pimeloyl-ACP methyl ester carboxylesterase